MKFCLGVLNVPEPYGGNTEAVARDLEQHYALFTSFYRAHEPAIVAGITQALADAAWRGKGGPEVFADLCAELTTDFKAWINSGAAEGDVKSRRPVPTRAALEGLNYRKKAGRGARRPSFVYSGTLVGSLQVWVAP